MVCAGQAHRVWGSGQRHNNKQLHNINLGLPVESFVAGDEVVVLGAAVAGGNLYTTISSISGTTVVLSDAASTATSSAILQKQSAVGSITGFDDLQDDASGIVKMGELMGQLVIYKDTSNFLARYTGVPTSPFSFARLAPLRARACTTRTPW